MPYGLLSGYAASRAGEHWAMTPDELQALSAASVGVLNELIPMLPVLDDSPLAAALTQLAIVASTVMGPRVYLTYLQGQAARAAQEVDATQANHAQQHGIGGLEL